MQPRKLGHEASERPAYQFCVLVTNYLNKVTPVVHKYTKHTDDFDILREDIKSLRAALEFAKPLVDAYEAQRKPVLIPPELEHKCQQGVARLVRAEEHLSTLSAASAATVTSLQNRYKTLQELIKRLESTPEAAQINELESKLERLQGEYKALNKQCDQIRENPPGILSLLSSSGKKQWDNLPYLEEDLRAKKKQITVLEEQIKKLQMDLNLKPLQAELAEIDEQLIEHDAQFKLETQQAHETVNHTRSKALRYTLARTQIILENNLRVSDDILYALLRVYARLINVFDTIQLTYQLMSRSDKVYTVNTEEEDPRKRIRYLHDMVTASFREGFDTTFGILVSPRSGENSGVNIYEHYETLDQKTKDLFLKIDTTSNHHSIPAALMDAILPPNEEMQNNSFLTGASASSLFKSQSGRMKPVKSRQIAPIASVFAPPGQSGP